MTPKLTLPKNTVVPNHIALVLDGNRRWARSHNLNTLRGHQKGFQAAKAIVTAANGFGVHTMTLWGFSTENWDRSPREISYLMRLFERMINDFRDDMHKNKSRFIHLGRKDRLPKSLIKLISNLEAETKHYTKHTLNIALDYGGRDEIIRVTQKLIAAGLKPEEITEEKFMSFLDTTDQPYPYPDLFIRTSGEQRTSGLLPWQMTYSEYYWEQEHLPDFTPEKLRDAILDYSLRRRRFGKDEAVTTFKFKPTLVAKFEVNWWRLSNIPQGERLRDYAIKHLKEQFGLSTTLAAKGATHMIEGILFGKKHKWVSAKKELSSFYKLIKQELKLAFEPKIIASLEVQFLKEINKSKAQPSPILDALAQKLYSETYRISSFQATKIAHLRVLAEKEKALAEAGYGDHHWLKAEDYLFKFYTALKDKVA